MDTPFSARQIQIIEASLRVIDRLGLQKFTVKNIASDLGLTDAALYKHFPDKSALLGAIASYFKTTTYDLLLGIHQDSHLSGLEKLEKFVKGRAQQFQENPALTAVLFSEEIFRGDEAVSRQNNELLESHGNLLMKIVEEGQRDGSLRPGLPPAHLVLLLTGPMRLMTNSWRLDPTLSPPLTARVSGFWKTYADLVSGQ